MAEQSSSVRILLADDDPNIAELIQMECEAEGYSVTVCSDGKQALASLRESQFDLTILDWDMPILTGIDLCKRMRDTGIRTPVLMVTAKDQVDDRINALDAGADDYLSKPFNIREMLARVRALLRRSTPDNGERDLYEWSFIRLMPAEHRCLLDGKDIHLTVREFDLLEALMINQGLVMSKSQLIEKVWGDDYFGDDTVVDTFVKYLRQKLEAGGRERVVQTVRGVGFSLR